MKIREVLELTKDKTIAEIARDELEVGEKMARLALKRSGCYAIVGQRGWFFDESENPENLDRSIYEFVEQIREERRALERQMANVGMNDRTEKDVFRKRYSFDLEAKLMRRLKMQAVQEDRPLYLIVEEVLRDYLDRQEEGKANG